MQWWLEDRGKNRVQRFLQGRTLMQWKWIEGGIVMLVGALGIWPTTVGIGGKE